MTYTSPEKIYRDRANSLWWENKLLYLVVLCLSVALAWALTENYLHRQYMPTREQWNELEKQLHKLNWNGK